MIMTVNDPTQPAEQDSPKEEGVHFRILEDIARNLSGEINFPTSIDLAIMLRNILKNPEATADEIARVVAVEPLIASKILRLANSHAYNPCGPTITDLNAAIKLLGPQTVRTASLAMTMDQVLKSKNLACFDKFAKLTWEHSILSAAIAQVLARHVPRINPQEAMLAGLVHDIGIYYLFYRASEFSEYLDNETALFELVMDWHESVGESVLAALGVPEEIVNSVRDHDRPRLTDSDPYTMSDIVYIANLLAGSNWEWLPNTVSAKEEQAMNKTRERYCQVLAEAKADIRELRAALSD